MALVLRLSNHELFTLQTSWIKKSPPSLIKLSKYKDTKFSYAFSRVYFKKCCAKLGESNLQAFEHFISQTISDNQQHGNLELVLKVLQVLGLFGSEYAASKFSIGEFKR